MNDTSAKPGLTNGAFASAVLDAPQHQASVVLIGLGDARDEIDPMDDPSSVSCTKSVDGVTTHDFGV